MSAIHIEHQPDEHRLGELGVRNWPTWSKEVSSFPWTYDEPETCYILEGKVLVTPHGGHPTTVKQGDLVTFPAGMSCTWEIQEPIKKHYRFG